jgi:predicted transcriptional regulator
MLDEANEAVITQHGFSFLTNYAHVLLLIAHQPDIRMREVAAEVGITERAVQRIVEDLANNGYLKIIKEGRRNRYLVKVDKSLRHPVEKHCTVGDLIHLVFPKT